MTVLDFSPYSSLSREKILHQVRSQMSQRRFDHCLRVEKKIIGISDIIWSRCYKSFFSSVNS